MAMIHHEALINLTINWKQDVVSFQDSEDRYNRLITLAVENGYYATIVVSQSWFNSPPEFIDTIRQDVVATVESPRWPGTQLLEANATIYWLQVSRGLGETLKSVGKFLNWIRPDYPEDLCLWNSNLEWVIGSVAHEGMCFMNQKSRDIEKCRAIIGEEGINKLR